MPLASDWQSLATEWPQRASAEPPAGGFWSRKFLDQKEPSSLPGPLKIQGQGSSRTPPPPPGAPALRLEKGAGRDRAGKNFFRKKKRAEGVRRSASLSPKVRRSVSLSPKVRRSVSLSPKVRTPENGESGP